MGFRDSLRIRGGRAATVLGMTLIGEEGTGGRRPSGGGRRFVLVFGFGRGGRSKDALLAVVGTGGREKADPDAGVDGGCKRAVRGLHGSLRRGVAS